MAVKKKREPRRQVMSITRQRAKAIARCRLAAELLEVEVFEALPPGLSYYRAKRLPLHAWYVLCRPCLPPMLDGPEILFCISRRTGRVLLRVDAYAGG